MRHGRTCLGPLLPQPVPLGAAKGAVGSQPASDFWSAPEGLAAGESAVRPSWGQCLASALLDVCWGQRENAPPNPGAPERCPAGMGGQHPPQPGSAPACATGPALPCSQASPGSLQGQKKALSVKPRKPQEVNAALESGDASLFTSRVISGWFQAWPGTEAVGGPSRAGQCRGLAVPPLGTQSSGAAQL